MDFVQLTDEQRVAAGSVGAAAAPDLPRPRGPPEALAVPGPPSSLL